MNARITGQFYLVEKKRKIKHIYVTGFEIIIHVHYLLDFIKMENLARLAWSREIALQDIQTTTKNLNLEKTRAGNTILYCASWQCEREIVEAILDKGVDINGLSLDNWTPLMAACFECRWDIVTLLLSRGANASIPNTYKRTALHIAARKKAPEEILKALLDAGADPKAEDVEDRTPADYANDIGDLLGAKLIREYCVRPIKSANFNV
jgi:ankyrin repeat protein